MHYTFIKRLNQIYTLQKVGNASKKYLRTDYLIK